jgi:radical SAM protein with 4Fe4S-binding SPASM domain
MVIFIVKHTPPIRDVRYQVTRACNLRCYHCFSSSAKALKDELTLEEAKEMAVELKEYGAKFMTLTGGEPLLRKQFVLDFTAFLNSLGMYTRLFTNGYLLTEEIAQKLKENGIREVQVSIDGLKDVHDDFRGVSGSFDRCILAIEHLKSTDIRTIIRTTIIPQNCRQMPKIIDLARNMNVDGFRARPFVGVGRGLQNREYILSPQEHEIAMNYLTDIRRKISLPIQLLQPSFPFLYDPKVKPKTQYKNYRGYRCTCGKLLCAITPDGYVKACGYFSNNLGNIKDESFAKIWYENDFVCDLRELKKLNEFCMRCEYLAICGGGCRASAFENSGNLESIDLLCPKYRLHLLENSNQPEDLVYEIEA